MSFLYLKKKKTILKFKTQLSDISLKYKIEYKLNFTIEI